MKTTRNIAEKKSVINCLLLAMLSAGIFLLHQAGAGRPEIQKEAIPIAAGFQGEFRNIPGIYEVSTAASNQVRSFENNSFQFSVLKALSKKLNASVSLMISKSDKELPLFVINFTQHFRSRSLASEDPFISFS